MNIIAQKHSVSIRRVSIGFASLVALLGAVALPHIIKTPSAYADVSGAYTYSVSDGEATITDYDPAIGGTSVAIPSELNGNTVVAVGPTAFADKGINSVILPVSLKSIEVAAFAQNNITDVVIPSSVTSLASSMFSANPLQSVVIGESSYTGPAVLTVPGGAFYDIGPSLTSVVLHGNVQVLSSGSFTNNGITNLTLHEGLEVVQSAFNQNNIESVELPNSLQTVNSGAFLGNPLKNLRIGTADYTGSPHLVIDYGAFASLGIETLYIGNVVETIRGGAFSGNSLTTLSLPNSVKTLETSSFAGNPLTSITIGTLDYTGMAQLSIPAGVFSLSQLTSLNLGNSVLTISDGAFQGAPLTSLTIPNSVTSIRNAAFENAQLTTLVLGESLASIGHAAFSGNQLTDVTIPATVTSIGVRSFAANDLHRVTIEGTPTIGDEAFAENGFYHSDLPSGAVKGDTAWYNYIEQNAQLVNVYTTASGASYADTLYLDASDNRVLGGYIINPASFTVSYKDAGGSDVTTSTTYTAPQYHDYKIANTLTVSSNPNVDFSPYYRIGNTITSTPPVIDGYQTPAAQSITLNTPNTPSGQSGVTIAFVYQAIAAPSSPTQPTPGAPNTGVFSVPNNNVLLSALVGGIVGLATGLFAIWRRRNNS